MTVFLEDVWAWAKTAPLPVVLALTLSLGAWLYAVDTDQAVEKVRLDNVARQADRMDGKLDRLLEAVADLKAEQRATAAAMVAVADPAPRTHTSKEK